MAQGQNIDSLKLEINKTDRQTQLEASWELFKYYRVHDRDSALLYAMLNNSVAEKLGDTLAVVKSLNAMGYLYREGADFSNSITSYEKALALAKQHSYIDQVKFLLNNLAIVYGYYGKYDKSLDYNFQSLRIREKEKDIQGIYVAYNNIGLVYYKLEDYEKALAYFRQSLDLAEQNEIDYELERNLINIGLAYTGLGDYSNALQTFNELINICNNSCADDIALIMYSSVAYSYFMIGDYDRSEVNYIKSIELAAKLDDKLRSLIAYYYLASISFKKENINKCLELLATGEHLVLETDAQEWKMQIDDLYSQVYNYLGNYKLAYYYKNQSSLLKDSIFNEELIKNLANVQLNFQEEQAQEIIATKDFQILRRTQINLLLGGITFLISALLIILYKNIQDKKKANKKLAEANNIIEDQNKKLTDINSVLEDRVKERTKELKKANVALKKSNEELDNFIYKTSHDIRGPLATLMGVCNIAQIDVKDTQALDYFDKLSITATKLNAILSKLLTINHINNTALQMEDLNLKAIITDLVVEGRSTYGDPEIQINIEIADGLEMTADFELIRVIFGNLINNAIKFRDTSDRRESIVNMRMYENENWFIFRIVDNGIGISEAESEKIFEVFSRATDIADSSGIGLYLVKLAVEKLNGNVQHGKTTEGQTLFEVKIPN